MNFADFAFPATSAFFRLPSDTPFWQKGMYAALSGFEIVTTFMPPARAGFSAAVRPALYATNRVAAHYGEKQIIRTAEKKILPLTDKKLVNRSINDATTALKTESSITRKIADKVSGVQSSRNRFSPDSNATGAHSVFRRDPMTGKVSHYETFRSQTNHYDPKPWESIKRFDGYGGLESRHYNKIQQKYIETPHVHDPLYEGGVRYPEIWEIPR